VILSGMAAWSESDSLRDGGVVRKRDDEEVYSGGGEEEAGWRGLNRVGSSVVGLGRFSAV
jgi:hypothetical protein